MSAVNANEIEATFEAVTRKHGPSEAVRMFASMLLDSLISEQTKFSQAAERRATEAERMQVRIITSGTGDE